MHRIVGLIILALALMAAPVAAQWSPLPGDLASAKDACWTSASSWQTYESCVTAATITTIEPGTWFVGVEIPAGTYKTPGIADDGTVCSASRLSGFGGASSELLDVAFVYEGDGSLIVTIDPTDAGFQTSDCQPWVLVQAATP